MRVTKKLLLGSVVATAALVLAACAPQAADSRRRRVRDAGRPGRGHGRHRHERDRASGRLRQAVPRRLQGRSGLRDRRHERGRRHQDHRRVQGRCGRPRQGRHRRQGAHRRGRQHHRRQRLIGRRARRRRAGRAEQGAVRLGPRRGRRDHRHQRVHIPLGSPERAGCRDRGHLPRRHRGQDDHRVRAEQRVRPGQRGGRQGDPRRAGRDRQLGARRRGRHRVHAVRAAGARGQPRPRLRGVGRRDLGCDVAGDEPAGRARRDPGRHRSRRLRDLRRVRRGIREDQLPEPLLPGRERQRRQHGDDRGHRGGGRHARPVQPRRLQRGAS